MYKIYVPPIKIQGIKTKLVPVISKNVQLSSHTMWVEPFMGSGVVGFNIADKNAVFADKNPHIIEFYNQIKSRDITSNIVKIFLEKEGKLLEKNDADYYYIVRDRFNEYHNPLDFLFLNRACFNGMIRFNKDYKYNVPYGHHPMRFSKSYITKIVNQVKYVENKLFKNNWVFKCQSFEKTIAGASPDSFIYCDPPYIDRHVDYYDTWDVNSEIILRNLLIKSDAKFMVSTWDYNMYRKNDYIDEIWGFCRKIKKEHFYYIGAKEVNRNPMMEALLVNYPPNPEGVANEVTSQQMTLSV